MPLVKKTLYFDDLKFGYDSSILREYQKKNKKIIVLSATLKMKKISDIYTEKAKYIAKTWQTRKIPQPKISCGSTFQSLDPEVAEQNGFPATSAGYVIDKILGLKGYINGGIMISEYNANFLPNTGNASSNQVLETMKIIRSKAKQKGVNLIPEINHLGFDESEIKDIWEE